MNALRGGAPKGKEQPSTYELAKQLVDNPDQLHIYDQAKWNLLGHAVREERFMGHYPWLKRMDSRGVERTMSVPVFSGFSADTQTALIVRKDPWTHQNDPESWVVAEQSLATGEYVEPKILSVNVDAARRMWIQLAPRNYQNWPPGYHPSLYARPYDQIRLTGKLDDDYHLAEAEYRAGQLGSVVQYEDIEALESMIVAVQRLRWSAAERAFLEAQKAAHQQLGVHGLVALEYAA